LFPGAVHVEHVNLAATDDSRIWEFAKV